MLKLIRKKIYQYLLKRNAFSHLSDKAFHQLAYSCDVGGHLDLDHPKTFCEKVNWLKMHDHNPYYPQFADKAEVKKAVSEIIGPEYVVPLYGVYDSFEDIDFDQLPNQFVLKCTHDSGSYIVCKDKATFAMEEARQHFHERLKRNYYGHRREWVYKAIRPRILAEAYIEGLGSANSTEYKFTCFNGRVGFFTVCQGIPHNTYDVRTNDFYDRDLNPLPFYVYYKHSVNPPALPEEIHQMIELSEKLSKGIVQVRVDWYLHEGRLYFGEMTFYTWGGICEFTPKEWDRKVGDMIDLSLVKEPAENKDAVRPQDVAATSLAVSKGLVSFSIKMSKKVLSLLLPKSIKRPLRAALQSIRYKKAWREDPMKVVKGEISSRKLEWMMDEAYLQHYAAAWLTNGPGRPPEGSASDEGSASSKRKAVAVLDWKTLIGQKKPLDLKHPRTITEKLNYLKLHDHNPDYHWMADKYEMKKYVAGLFGEDHVLPMYGVWDRFDDIDFDALPSAFVLKCTHDSGGFYPVPNKDKLDRKKAQAFFEKRMRKNDYFYQYREWVYKDMTPRILAEKYEPELTTYGKLEYNCFCFNGRTEYVYFYNGKNNTDHSGDWSGVFFDREGKRMPFHTQHGAYEGLVELPSMYSTMIEWSDRLAKDIPFLRVDWYVIRDTLYFGEVTFYPLAGFMSLSPSKWNETWGQMVDIRKVQAKEKQAKAKKNLLFITPKLFGGGAERVISRLANQLKDKYNVFIYSAYPRDQKNYPTDPEVTLLEYRPSPRIYFPKEQTLLLDKIRHLRQVKKTYHIHCSISFLRTCNYLNVMSRRFDKVVVSIRCILKNEPYPNASEARVGRIMQVLAAKGADQVVGVSKLVSKEQIDDFGAAPSKVISIYNPIDVSQMDRLRKEPVEDPAFEAFAADKRFLFVTAGRLTHQKGQWHLIRAFRTIAQRQKDVGLVILGTGPMEGYLREVVMANGLIDQVYFAGYSYRPFAYYGRCHAFVFPSLAEGFPNALLEAMACRLPVISADCPSGPRELLSPGTDILRFADDMEMAPYGILVPPLSKNNTLITEDNEPSEAILEKAMERLLSDETLQDRYREAGYWRCRDFAPETIADEWIHRVIESRR